MTHQQKIEAIRQRCVEVNFEKDWEDNGYDMAGNYCEGRKSPTLADVLLASDMLSLSVTGSRGYFLIQGKMQMGNKQWNLRKDSLDEQSEETIDFIWSLLTPNSSKEKV